MNQLLKPYGYSPSESSIAGVIFILSGLFGSFSMGYFLDRKRRYLLTLRVVCFGSLLTAIAFAFTLPTQNKFIIGSNVGACGFFLLPIIPVGYSFGSELTYPVSETMSNGIMSLFA